MRPFRLAIHGRPDEAAPGPGFDWGGCVVETLSPGGASPPPLPVTFEEAEAALLQLPRLYFEPDGSFGWFSEAGAPRWDLGGMLYDRGDRVMYAELTGACIANAMSDLLAALGSRQAPLMIQVLDQGVFLTPRELCRVLAVSD